MATQKVIIKNTKTGTTEEVNAVNVTDKGSYVVVDDGFCTRVLVKGKYDLV